MFNYLRLWSTILLGIGGAVMFAVTAVTIFDLHSLDQLIQDAEKNEINQYAAILKVKIAHETQLAETLSALTASIPEVQKRFAAGDRAWLKTQLLPAFKNLEDHYQVAQFQFHTPPATSFLRLHMVDKFGDDLTNLRPSVVKTNAELKPQHGLELGVSGLGARGIVPIFEQGRHVGSVEFGMAFDANFFKEFKQNYGVDAGFYLVPAMDRIERFTATYGRDLPFPATMLHAAFAGIPQYLNIDNLKIPMMLYAEQMQDYSGSPLGVITVARERARYQKLRDQAFTDAWAIGGGVLLGGLIIALGIAQSLARRIRKLGEGVQRLAAGNLTEKIILLGRDEIAELATVLNQMRWQLHSLVSQVEANAGLVQAAAQEIAQAVDGQAATASEMSASVAEITSTMEELSASSSQIAEYSGSVAEIARRTYDNSLQGSSAMQLLVRKMEEIRRDNQHALAEIVQLGSTSKEIGKIMEIIDNLADQTKLIAFNAALEACSAGESGKRFGVVAAEIRRLADSVTESTSEIEVKVNETQEAISRLVITSEKGAVGIEEGLAASGRAAEFLQNLVQATNETKGSAQQIGLSTQQQRTASNQVVVALREIVTASADTADSMHKISQIVQEMTHLASTLKTHVDRFTLHDQVSQSLQISQVPEKSSR